MVTCAGHVLHLPCAPHLCRQKQIPDSMQPGKYVYAYSPCELIDCSTSGANATNSDVSVEDEVIMNQKSNRLHEHSESILYQSANNKYSKSVRYNIRFV